MLFLFFSIIKLRGGQERGRSISIYNERFLHKKFRDNYSFNSLKKKKKGRGYDNNT